MKSHEIHHLETFQYPFNSLIVLEVKIFLIYGQVPYITLFEK